MSLPTLIANYNSPIGNSQHVNNRIKYLKGKSYQEVLDCILKNGPVPFDGVKIKVNTHFRNNFWYSRFQPHRDDPNRTQVKTELYKRLSSNPINKRSGISTFEDIFQAVKDIMKEISDSGVKGTNGQLLAYDVALYIGSSMNILPEKMLYIHRGARTGAYELGLISKKSEDAILAIEEVYTKCPELKQLGNSDHIENFLCIAFNKHKANHKN